MLWSDLVELKGTEKSTRAWAAIPNLFNHRLPRQLPDSGLTERSESSEMRHQTSVSRLFRQIFLAKRSNF